MKWYIPLLQDVYGDNYNKEEKHKEAREVVERAAKEVLDKFGTLYVKCSCPICGCSVVYPICNVDSIGKVGQCYNCGMFYSHIIPHPEIIKGFYRGFIPGFLVNAEIWNNDLIRRHKLNNSDLNIIERFVDRRGIMFDLGACGGDFLLYARERGWNIVGQELSEECTKIMKLLDIPVVSGFVHENVYIPKLFDVISLRHVLEHSPCPLYDLQLLREALTDDGILFIVVPIWQGEQWCVEGGHKMPEHIIYFTDYTLNTMLHLAGFNVLLMELLPSSSAITDSSFKENKCNLRVVAKKRLSNQVTVFDSSKIRATDWEEAYEG